MPNPETKRNVECQCVRRTESGMLHPYAMSNVALAPTWPAWRIVYVHTGLKYTCRLRSDAFYKTCVLAAAPGPAGPGAAGLAIFYRDPIRESTPRTRTKEHATYSGFFSLSIDCCLAILPPL